MKKAGPKAGLFQIVGKDAAYVFFSMPPFFILDFDIFFFFILFIEFMPVSEPAVVPVTLVWLLAGAPGRSIPDAWAKAPLTEDRPIAAAQIELRTTFRIDTSYRNDQPQSRQKAVVPARSQICDRRRAAALLTC
jgi:hypothetical protein